LPSLAQEKNFSSPLAEGPRLAAGEEIKEMGSCGVY
jgi:hypothetical protein